MPYRQSAVVRFLLPVSVYLLVFGLYANSLYNPFVLFDQDIILRHPDVIEPQGLYTAWLHDARPTGSHEGIGIYRPVTIESFHLNARLTGLQPQPYYFRLVNVLLLGTLGWLAGWWFGRYLHPLPAFLGTYVLVGHPLNAELINHVVGRADLLAMLGIVGFALAQRRALMNARWTPFYALAAVMFAVMAIGSKETGLLVIPIALIQGWVADRPDSPQQARARRKVHLVTFMLLVLPLAAYLVGRHEAVDLDAARIEQVAATGDLSGPAQFAHRQTSQDLTRNPLVGRPLMARLPASLSLGWFYLKQIAWPDTSFNQTPAHVPGWGDRQTYLGLTVLVVIILITTHGLIRRHWLAIVGLLALGQFVVVCNILVPAGAFAANRLTLPFTFAAAAVVAAVANKLSRGSLRGRAIVVVPILLVLAFLGRSVFLANRDWAGKAQRMQADYARQHENPITMHQYAEALEETGRQSDAVEYYRKAVAARPESVQARESLANALYKTSHYEESAGQYRQLAQRFPLNVGVRLRLVHIAMIQNDLQTAQRYLNEARLIAPDDPQVLATTHRLSISRKDFPQLPTDLPKLGD